MPKRPQISPRGRLADVFTGLIEEMGTYLGHEGDRYGIRAKSVLEDMAVGDSVAVNGCCVTVISFHRGGLGDRAHQRDAGADDLRPALSGRRRQLASAP